MKRWLKTFFFIWVGLTLGGFLLSGCTTYKINWDSRIGNYTYDQAVIEMGPPERTAKLTDGRTVSEWLAFRGRSGGYHSHYSPGFYSPAYGNTWYHSEPSFPDQFVRLTFSPQGRLESWKKVAK